MSLEPKMGFSVHLMNFERCACVGEWTKLVGEDIWRANSSFYMQGGLDLLGFLVHVGWTKVNTKYPQQLLSYTSQISIRIKRSMKF